MSNPLYHGTDQESMENIVNVGINLNKNPRGGDFAVGFYLTPMLNSAKDMALRKSFSSNNPSIVELTLKKEFEKMVKVKNFGIITLDSDDSQILAWAQFIVNNRCGVEYIKSVSMPNGLGDNNIDKRYDVIIGSIADGNVTLTAKQCKSQMRLVTLSEAKKFLDKSFGLQYCISTEDGLSAIDNPPREKKGVSWR